MSDPCLLITCEHGGNRIPAAYLDLFEDNPDLDSHRGWDTGALILARQMAKSFNAPLHASTTSRLLVDLNRSPNHRHLFSGITRFLDDETKNDILNTYYFPYRMGIEKDIRKQLDSGKKVLHISVHSFTPELDGIIRDTDIGLLYDPGRKGEKSFCRTWQESFNWLSPQLKIRRNYPYTGVQDGLVTAMRKKYTDEQYLGVEIETNQRLVMQGDKAWQYCRDAIVESLDQSLLIYSG